MKILFLSRWYPVPPDNGSKIRVLNLLRALCERHRVTLVSFTNPNEPRSERRFSLPSLDDVHVCPYLEFRPYSRRALLGFLSAQPRFLLDTYRPEMDALIRRVTHGTRFDLIIASQIAMACYHRCFLGIPAIFEEVELGSFHPDGLEQSPLAPKIRARLRWAKFRRFMAGLLPKFICCTVASELERRLLAEAVPGYSPVHVIPNSLELNSYSMPEKDRRPGSLIFAGSLRYSANLDAMTWFLSEIYPHIRSSRGDVSLTVTGDPGPAKLTDAPGVAATGRVDDVKEWIGSAMVSVAPIRTGGGTRLKILESFALRTPVVATSKAAEGLDVRTGEHLLLADTAEEFARSVLLLLDDPERSRQMAARAFDLVRARYDWGALSREFLSLIDRAGTSSAALSQEASR